MEEEPKNEKKPEFKGNLGLIWLIGILVILLGCVTVYTLKLTKENKELKQAPEVTAQPVQQVAQTPVTTQEQAKTENTTTENTKNNKEVYFDNEKLEEYFGYARVLKKFNKLSEASFDRIIWYAYDDNNELYEDNILNKTSEIKKAISKKFVIDDEEKVEKAIKKALKNYEFGYDEVGGDIATGFEYVTKILDTNKVDNNKYIIKTVNYIVTFNNKVSKDEKSVKPSYVSVEDCVTGKDLKINFYKKYYEQIKDLPTTNWKQGEKLLELIAEYSKENKIGYKEYTVTGTSVDNFKIVSIK